MITFLQVLILFTMGFLLFETYSRWKKAKIGNGSFLFWTASWIGVLIMSFVPRLLTSISKFTGTTPRDLAVHLAIVFLFILYYKFDATLKKQEENLKELRRMLAKEAK